MKVNVNLTVELDPQVWAAEYGLAVKDVRDDVKLHVTNTAYSQFAEVLGIVTDVYLTGTK